MIEKVEVDATVSGLSGTAAAVPENGEVDNAVCTDIAARDEVNPINAQAQRISDVRSRFENLGADMQHIMGLLYKLQGMSIGQQNLDAAGKTVDDIYARVIDLEARVEELDDEVVKQNDFDPDNYVADCDLEDRVLEILRERVTFNVDIDIS
jgi:hypothetical protein|tara:strand:+ start:256 stop:711 length:456 start_codon:yes stop_codon:yes gene_type:complete